MYESGETIYFRREGDSRALRGEVLEQQGDHCLIRGMRSATCSTRPMLTIPASEILPVQAVKRQPKYKRECNGAGMSVPVVESIERKQVGAERLGLDEGAVLFAEPMQQLCRRIVGRLARGNGINRQNAEYSELVSEYLVAALQAIRTQTSKASDEELAEFLRFLAGDDQVFGKIIVTIARTGKTAVIRYLKKRKKYHQTHRSLEILERRVAA